MKGDLDLAFETIEDGGVVAVPTDTVYGLLADATNENAIKKIFKLKKRPQTKPLIVLVSNLKMAAELGEFSKQTEAILRQLWIKNKYPITVILKVRDNVSKLITSGGDTIALRLPNNPFCLSLIEKLKKPVVAPSANISGENTPTSYEDVKNHFGNSIPIIKGQCGNQASTIIDLTSPSPKLIREGAIPQDIFLNILSFDK